MARYDSGARFRVAALTLVASLLLPVLSLAAPRWRVLPTWSRPPAVTRAATAEPVRAIAPPPGLAGLAGLAVGASSRSHLERRIMAILDSSTPHQPSLRARIAVRAVAATLVPLATLAWSAPRPAQPPAAPAIAQHPSEGRSDVLGRLEDESAQVREWATRVLGALGDSRAVPAISARLGDQSADVRYWAQRALEALE